MQLTQEFYTFEKSHVLGFDQFHSAILTEKEKLKVIKIEEIKKEQLLGVELEDELKVYVMTKIENNQYEKKLLLTNPIAGELLNNIKAKLSINRPSTNKENFPEDIHNCLEEEYENHPDLLVEDIYGKDSSSIGLPEKLLASSLGKLSKTTEQMYEAKEIIRSLVMALAINTAQIAGLLSRKHKIPEIYILKSQIKGVSFFRLVYVIFFPIETLLNLYSPESGLYVPNEAK